MRLARRSIFRRETWPRWVVLLAMAIMVARIVPTYTVFNDTIDEPYHLGAGLCLLQTGKLWRGYQHPPLTRLLAALPVYLSGVRDTADRNLRKYRDDVSAFDVGHPALLNSDIGYWQVLTRARVALLIFPLIAIAYVYRLTRWLAGRSAGALAALFFSTDPTLLGHATWIATDVAGCAGFLAAIYHGGRFVAHPSARSALIAGIAFGLGSACKFNVALAAPAIATMFLLHRPKRWKQLLWLLLIGVIAFDTLWATYLFHTGRTGFLPMPMLWRGLWILQRHVTDGHAAYFNGQFSGGGWFWYFPEAIALKSPLALLAALLVAIIVWLRRRDRVALLLMIPFVIFLLPAMLGKLDIGVRHVLPAIALLYPLIAVLLKRTPWLIALFAVIAFVETGVSHPDYVSFFNLAAGGSSGGQRFLLDSNLDWGQDLERARQWLEANAHGRMVSTNLVANPRLQQWPQHGYTILPADAPLGDLLLLSRNSAKGLYGGYALDSTGKQVTQNPLTPPPGVKPIATIGTSIDVYQIKH